MKKWFIYVTDHHEGPFTVEEIRQGISEGKFSALGFVWAQGMSDWLPMGSVPDFNEAPEASVPSAPAMPPIPEGKPERTMTGTASTGSYTQIVDVHTMTGSTKSGTRGGITDEIATPASPIETRTQTGTYSTSTGTPSVGTSPGPEKTLTTVVEVNDMNRLTQGSSGTFAQGPRMGNVIDSPRTGNTKEIQVDPYSAAQAGLSSSAARMPTESKGMSGLIKGPLILVGIVAALFGLSKLGMLRPVEDKISGAFISVPELPDVSPEEYADLVKAAKAPLSQGPAVALAVSHADPLNPSFYVASNLPEGTRFEIYLNGIAATLLNTLDFNGKTDVVVTKHMGKSAPYRSEDGRVIPRGQYRIIVVESAGSQPSRTLETLGLLTPVSRELPPHVPTDRKVVYEKTTFIGTKDSTYTSRLKEFHDKLAQRAQTEILELKQFSALLDNQYATSQATFQRLKKQKLGPPQAKAWKQMDSNWLRLDDQLSKSLDKLTDESIKNDYVYGDVYKLVKVTQKRLNEMHAFEGMFFDRHSSLAEAEEQVSQITPKFEKLSAQLKSVLADIEREPTDKGGLPKHVSVTPADGGSP